MKKRVLIIADVPNWAWAKKAEQLKKHLDGEEFSVDVICMQSEPLPAGYDLYHTFEVNQPDLHGIRVEWRCTTGITAHVWGTWEQRHGAGTVRAWSQRARAFHANSKLLQAEIEPYLGRKVHYCPNGVDEAFYRRLRPRSSDKLVVGWVGKPNPRKGKVIVEEACQRAGVEFRYIERTSKNALPPDQMREFYQDIHVLAVASDMDGTPNPALEAAACECTIVSNAIGNMPEFIAPMQNGMMVARNVESYVHAFQALAATPQRAEAMGRAARRTIETDWTWKIMAQNYATMWREALR